MTDFKPGDKVTVTNPVQPTGHKGGETGVVAKVANGLVHVQEDRDGSLIAVFPEEITKS